MVSYSTCQCCFLMKTEMWFACLQSRSEHKVGWTLALILLSVPYPAAYTTFSVWIKDISVSQLLSPPAGCWLFLFAYLFVLFFFFFFFSPVATKPVRAVSRSLNPSWYLQRFPGGKTPTSPSPQRKWSFHFSCFAMKWIGNWQSELGNVPLFAQ